MPSFSARYGLAYSNLLRNVDDERDDVRRWKLYHSSSLSRALISTFNRRPTRSRSEDIDENVLTKKMFHYGDARVDIFGTLKRRATE